MSPLIIGITGLHRDEAGATQTIGAGKDAAAEVLIAKHGFVRIGVADPLKRICRDVFDFSDDQLWGSSHFRNEPDARYPRVQGRFKYPTTPDGAVWVPLHNERGFVLVDVDDFDRVTTFRWVLNKKEEGKSTDYARASISGVKVSLHQYIFGEVPEDKMIDHVNGDGLDNRKTNLRACTPRENRQNQKVRKDSGSVFKGVNWVADRLHWRAIVDNDTVGYFSREAEAAFAYDIEARRRFGQFARLNSQLFLTPRYALQQLGTQWGRDCYSNIWIEHGLRLAKTLLEDNSMAYTAKEGLIPLMQQYPQGEFEAVENWPKPLKGVVFSDVRFFNEYKAVKDAGGKVVRVKRFSPIPFGGVVDSAHESETQLSGYSDDKFDYVIDNSGSLHDLTMNVDRMYDVLTGRIMPYDEKQKDIPPGLRQSST